MNIVIRDFKNWISENNIFRQLKENDSNIFFHITPIYDVMMKLISIYDLNGDFTEDELNIFQVGYNYIFDYFNFVDVVFQNHCDDDYDCLEDLSKYIVYYTYLTELQDEIKDMPKDLKMAIENMLKYLYTYFENFEGDETVFMQYDKEISSIFQSEYPSFRGIVSIFTEINENIDYPIE